MSFGTYIKNRRIKLGLTQTDLAQFLSYSPQAISRYELDEVAVSLELLSPLCKILKVSINDFINQVDGEIADIDEGIKFDLVKLITALIYLRREHHLSQRQLAVKTNIPAKKISKIENGMAPNIDEFIALANFYNISYEELYYYEVSEKDIKRYRKKDNLTISIFSTLSVLAIAGAGILTPVFVNNNGGNNQDGAPVTASETVITSEEGTIQESSQEEDQDTSSTSSTAKIEINKRDLLSFYK